MLECEIKNTADCYEMPYHFVRFKYSKSVILLIDLPPLSSVHLP